VKRRGDEWTLDEEDPKRFLESMSLIAPGWSRFEEKSNRKSCDRSFSDLTLLAFHFLRPNLA
jgi:hypothetical protein